MENATFGVKVDEEALAAALSALKPIPGPSPTLTPLEEEVDTLAEYALGSAESQVTKQVRLDLEWFAQASLTFVDSVMTRDHTALDRLDALLRSLHREVVLAQHEPAVASGRQAELKIWESWIRLALEFVRSGAERVAPAALATSIGRRSSQFLRAVAECPGLNSRRIRSRMLEEDRATADEGDGHGVKRIGEAQLSRLGSMLRRQGLVFASRGATGLSWGITPRGQVVLDRINGVHDSSNFPVGSIVILAGGVPVGKVATEITEAEPFEVAVMRAGDVLTYQRDRSPVGAQDTEDHIAGAPPQGLEEALSVLLLGDGTTAPPRRFCTRVGGAQYVRVGTGD
ncbi:hypothetical protein [Catellatospora sp. TT07R-123]|uniref:hypothetical protein n=1 Tax=Catellatospora sp. TT07R-123 TaxID=2733863 RepID=UPI001BB442F8|nr:hypothetical protein [Catellatospora sp. TT07R-123]